MFTDEEADALVLGARIVQAWGDPSLGEAAGRVLEKIDAMDPPVVRRELADCPLHSPQFHADPELRERLGRVRQSINARRKLRFEYTRADSNESKRTVRPLGLFYWGGTWTCAAWCELREDFRTFRIDRMCNEELLDATFSISEEISLGKYLRERGTNSVGL